MSVTLVQDLISTVQAEMTLNVPCPKDFLIIHESYEDRRDHAVIGRIECISDLLKQAKPGSDLAFHVTHHETRDMHVIPVELVKTLFPYTEAAAPFLDLCQDRMRDPKALVEALMDLARDVNATEIQDIGTYLGIGRVAMAPRAEDKTE